MPKEGIFAKVVRGGMVKPGDSIEMLPKCATKAQRT